MKTLTTKQIIALIILLGIIILLPLTVFLTRQRQDIRKRAAGTGEVELKFNPSSGSYSTGSTFTSIIEIAKTADRTISASGIEVVLEVSDKFNINSASCGSPFDSLKLERITSQTVTLMCAISTSATPLQVTSTERAVASLNLTVKAGVAEGSAPLVFKSTRVTEAGIAGQAPDVSSAGQSASFTISSGIVDTPTPTTPSGSILTPTEGLEPTSNPTPTEVVPTLSRGPSISVNPTPGTDRDKYMIDVGAKNSLTFQIQGGTDVTPVPGEGLPITFSAKLSKIENTPDLYFKLRVVDDLAFTQETQLTGNVKGLVNYSVDTCNDPGFGTKDLYVPMKADDSGIYQPDATAHPVGFSPPQDKIAQVNEDGTVKINAVPGKYYTFILKAPKTRGNKVAEHLKMPDRSEARIFDWTTYPLDAGDVPDVNVDNLQDCTINVHDIEAIRSRLSKTRSESQRDIDVCDVNYDTVCNGNDISIVVTNLGVKNDDD